MSILSAYDKEKVLYFFEEICKIPHGSGNEKQLSDYILNYGKEKGFYCRQDEFLNVVIKKNGTAGYENSSAVIFQSHIDMVCQKDSDIEIDFLKDPINIVVDGDFIKAKGTTLGADNGIGVAYMMALLDSDTIAHPPIEMIFTTEEETGLCGAIGLDVSDIEGRKLINLDTEEIGVLMAGCSGGTRVLVDLPIEKESIPTGYIGYKLNVGGFLGGHSGAEIHYQRGNANCILGRALHKLQQENISYKLCEVCGGTVDNAICRESIATIFVSAGDEIKMNEIISEFEKIVIDEYDYIEENIIINTEKINSNFNSALAENSKNNFINSIILIPYGVQTMDTNICNLVESSTNIGIVETTDNSILIHNAVRSSIKSRMEIIINKIHTIAKVNGGTSTTSNTYPGWKFNPNSEIVNDFAKVYRKINNKDAEIMAIHAGLECGLFGEKIDGLDMISIGPEMYDVHTTSERVLIPTIFDIWELIKEALKEMK